MQDDRTIRQLVVDRIRAYLHTIKFYDPSTREQFDFDEMTDKQIVGTFEDLTLKLTQVRATYREQNNSRR